MSTVMDCGVANESEIHFQESGIKIIPVEMTYKSDTRNYDYVRAKVTLDAANVISENAKFPESVSVYVAQRKLCDLHIPENGITIQENSGHIELLDPRQFLNRGVVDKYFQSISLRDVVDWFEERVEEKDPYNVITDVILIDPNNCYMDPDEITADFRGHVTFARDIYRQTEQALEGFDDESLSNELEKFQGVVTRWEELTHEIGELSGGFDFDQVTLAECLKQIEEEFQVRSYIDKDGILRIGPVEADARFYLGGEHREAWTISDYNITVDPSKVSQVYVKGGNVMNIQGSSNPVDYIFNGEDIKLQTWGYATTDNQASYENATQDVPGEAVSVEASDVVEGMELEGRAAMRMEQEMASEVSGSITVNCVSSSPAQGYPQDIKPLDTFGVLPPRGDCHVNIPNTSFTVQSVKHEISTDSWKLQLDLSQLPQQEFHTASFKTEPTSAEFMSSEKFYEETGRYNQ